MSVNTTVEWWRPDALQHHPDATTRINPALETDDSPVGFWALMAFLFILMIAPQTIFPVLAPLRPAMLAAGLAIFAHLAGRMKNGRPMMEFTRESTLLAAMVTWAMLTVPFSLWPGGSVSYLLEFYIKTLMVFWLLANVINTVPRLQTMAWTLCLLSVPLALTGVKNYLTGNYFLESESRVQGYGAALTGNPNDLALMLNLLLPVCIALFFGSKRPIIRLLLVTIICLNVLAIFMTFSRGGFLTLATILVVYGWMLRKRQERRWVFLVLFLAIIITPFTPSNYVERISTITNIEEDDTGSAQTRWSDMVTATSYISKHPVVGAGLGMNILAMDQERGRNGTAIHNVYLQYAVELGIPGMILFLLLLKSCIKSVRMVRQRFMEENEFSQFFYHAEGIQVSLIAFAVAALFYPVGFHFYFYIIAGIAVAIKAICDTGDRGLQG